MVKGTDVIPQESADPNTGEIVVSEGKNPYSDGELRNISSIDDIRSLLGDSIGNASDLGSGFALLDKDSKARLVGVPCLFLFWNFNQGENGEFVSAHVVQLDKSGQVVGKYIVNDGSTGIYQQLRDYTNDRLTSQGLFVPNGLRRSEYDTEINGRTVHGVTYYIDNTPPA